MERVSILSIINTHYSTKELTIDFIHSRNYISFLCFNIVSVRFFLCFISIKVFVGLSNTFCQIACIFANFHFESLVTLLGLQFSIHCTVQTLYTHLSLSSKLCTVFCLLLIVCFHYLCVIILVCFLCSIFHFQVNKYSNQDIFVLLHVAIKKMEGNHFGHEETKCTHSNSGHECCHCTCSHYHIHR